MSASSAARRQEQRHQAHEESVARIRSDMPAILHGAGTQVNPETADVLARFCLDYAASLTRAALDVWGNHTPPPPRKLAKRKERAWDEPPKKQTKRGAVGLDVWKERTRAIHVQDGLQPAHFLLPLSNDKYVHGRITNALEQERFEDILYDPVIAEVIRQEGIKKKSKKKDEEEEDDDEDDDEEKDKSDDESNAISEDQEGEQIPTWPGLDDLLAI